MTWEERHAVHDTVLPRGGGEDENAPVFVPKDTMVRVNLWAMNRDEAVFGPEPHEFRPDRWYKIKPSRWEFTPFGGGPRICLGKEKATLETMFAIARIVQSVDALDGLDDEVQRIGKSSQQCNVKVTH